MRGKVVRYFDQKGYGFIKGDDDKVYFFHISKVKPNKDGNKRIEQGDKVEFNSIVQQKGEMAVNIWRQK